MTSTLVPPMTIHHVRRRRHRCLLLAVCFLFIVVFVLVAVILALTVFKYRQPRIQLSTVSVSGVSPGVTFSPFHVELNITLDLQMSVYNANRASFTHLDGKTQLSYRGAQVGGADVAPGRIPPRGSEQLRVSMTVEADRMAPELKNLLSDVMAGEVGFDANTRIPGTITVLRFVKIHAVATSACHVAIGFPDLKVRNQVCTQKMKL